ncbi:hypothetical protein ABET41_08650 [Metabacillus fastidiosus]|uniref:Uncharacterized protein n=1 Tax=Metabacillus fastidiosus TaxID=1458 RepID=A0ABU6NZR6_9BACI|nr:hypothetical protein [Metabacillus fastidiosus]MED4402526.1 hypothetical protein [Metabacillus fastidiosus]MED4455518.1 hypothetical protein [Metabacillus fastidiosus]MED4461885.1 hypothetical protein [Metabacillus fastidiosus]
MNFIIVLIYIFATIAGIFTVGVFAPLVGLAIGFPFHVIFLLTTISKRLTEIERKLDKE